MRVCGHGAARDKVKNQWDISHRARCRVPRKTSKYIAATKERQLYVPELS